MPKNAHSTSLRILAIVKFFDFIISSNCGNDTAVRTALYILLSMPPVPLGSRSNSDFDIVRSFARIAVSIFSICAEFS